MGSDEGDSIGGRDRDGHQPGCPPKSWRRLKKRAEENGESLSDLLRRGALMVLGICPTCGQKAPGEES